MQGLLAYYFAYKKISTSLSTILEIFILLCSVDILLA